MQQVSTEEKLNLVFQNVNNNLFIPTPQFFLSTSAS